MINKFDIIICGKVKDTKAGNPIIGYIIKIPKYSDIRIYIKCNDMNWLDANKYIKANHSNREIVSFRDFKEMENEIIDSEIYSTIALGSQRLIEIIQEYKVNKLVEKLSQAEINRRNKEKKISTEQIVKDTNQLYVTCIITIPNSALGIAGYVLHYKNKTYTVSKNYGLKLGREAKIKNAEYRFNGTIESLALEEGNRNIQRIKYNSSMQLLEDNTELNSAEILGKAASKIIGCIFNQVGIIIGVKVKIADKEYNLKLDTFLALSKRYNIHPYKKLSQEQGIMFSKNYGISTTYLRGQEMYRSLRVTSPYMTKDISIELYGAENTLEINDEIDYGDTEIRSKILNESRRIEENLIKSDKALRVEKSKLTIIGVVMGCDIFVQKLNVSTYYVAQYKDNYYIVGYDIARSITNNLHLEKFVTIWNREIRYNFYTDGKYIIARIKEIRQTAKKEIENDRNIK